MSREEIKTENGEDMLTLVNGKIDTEDLNDKEGSMTWPRQDIQELISRMSQHVPAKDHVSHVTRAKMLPWQDIAFGGYSSEECLRMWRLVLQRIRGFRFLGEVLVDAHSWVLRPWQHFYRSKRLNRHPDEPKRPPTPNALFLKDNYQKLKRENPQLKATEILKLANETYKTISPKKREKYIKKAAILKDVYETEREIFLKEHPLEIKKPVSKKPKKITAYNLFLEAELAKHGDSDKPLKSLYPDIRAKWKNLKESKKLKWITKVEELQKTLVGSSDVSDSLKSILTKEELRLHDKAEGKPTKPPNNVYSRYTKNILSSGELNHLPTTDRMKQISVMWKGVPEAEKTRLREQLSKEKLKYANQMVNFTAKHPQHISDSKETGRKRKVSTSGTSEDGDRKHKVPKLEAPPMKEEIIYEEETEDIKPKKPPSDILKFFKKVMKKENVRFATPEELSEAWEGLPKKKRKEYKRLHAEAVQQYESQELS